MNGRCEGEADQQVECCFHGAHGQRSAIHVEKAGYCEQRGHARRVINETAVPLLAPTAPETALTARLPVGRFQEDYASRQRPPLGRTGTRQVFYHPAAKCTSSRLCESPSTFDRPGETANISFVALLVLLEKPVPESPRRPATDRFAVRNPRRTGWKL